MRAVSDEAKTAIFAGYVPVDVSLEVLVDPENFDIVTIPASRLVLDSISIKYNASTNDEVQFGTVIAPDFTAEITNADGTYDRINFIGLEIRVYAELNVTGSVESLLMGCFICDAAQKLGDNISIRALGKITKMDKTYQTGDIAFPISLYNFATSLITGCGLNAKVDLTRLRNSNVSILAEPEGGKYTYRQLLGYACELMAVCAQTTLDNGSEKVYIRWAGREYDAQVDHLLTYSNVFSDNIEKNPLFLSGCDVIGSKNSYTDSGTGSRDNFVYTVKDNPLVDLIAAADLANVSDGIKKNGYREIVSYQPYYFWPSIGSMVIMTNPLLEPLDNLMYNFNGVPVPMTVGNIVWYPQKNTEIVTLGYRRKDDKGSPFTNEQSTIIDGLQNAVAVDFVTENGSDANGWRWRKWNSGRIELDGTHVLATLDPTDSAWGSSGLNFKSGSVALPSVLTSDDFSAVITIDRTTTGSNALIGAIRRPSAAEITFVIFAPAAYIPSTLYLNVHVSGT